MITLILIIPLSIDVTWFTLDYHQRYINPTPLKKFDAFQKCHSTCVYYIITMWKLDRIYISMEIYLLKGQEKVNVMNAIICDRRPNGIIAPLHPIHFQERKKGSDSYFKRLTFYGVHQVCTAIRDAYLKPLEHLLP